MALSRRRRSRHRTHGRFLRRIAIVSGLLIAVAGGSYFYLLTSLPATDGAVAVPGLYREVRIARDPEGIPTIIASNDEDAAFGLGFVHAQDRLFQMELRRRYGAGRLAELFGESAVSIDRQMRILGLYRSAAAAFAHLSPPVQQGIEAYCAGVNAYLETHRGMLPFEFTLLHFSPEPWKPADTLVWGKLMDYQLAGNYRGELLRARLARTVSPDDLGFLYPEYPRDAPTTLAALAPLYRQLPVEALYATLPERLGPHFASNNWVVDGAHSASGRPLLANDPHLAFGAPGFWYLARLKTRKHDIVGGTVAGTPLVIVGHNDRIAWGMTTTTADIEDLFIEKLDPSDPGRYLTPDGSTAFATRQETITVRNGAPVTLTVRTTRHGPVVSDMLPAGTTETGYVMALQTTFLDDDDRTAEALWEVDRAADWTEFRESLKKFTGPPHNIVYADVDGTIGFIAPGKVPIRRAGDGWLPVPGWTGDNDWQGYIPFDELPQGTNPPSGHFITANNKIVPETYPYFISRDWDIPNRAQRIEELLAATPVQSPDASAAIQADTLSIMARRLVPLMTRIVPASEAAREAVQRLQQWDFEMDADKVEPLLFTAWLREFARSVLFARLGDAAAEYWDLKPNVMEAVLTQRPEWCDDPKRPGTETCQTRLAAALDTALAQLRQTYGGEMADWQWGRAHIAVFPNRLLERIPILRDWLRVSVPTSGGYDTINRGPSVIRGDHPFEQRFGAGLRMIVDMAKPAEARIIAAPGQSGNPLSSHYRDLLARWRRFGWLLPGTTPAEDTLALVPKQ